MQAPSPTPGPKSADKIKVAVLGGGVGALTAALRLTATQADRDRHDVTVWQMGWRLGGKCASGRDMSRPPAARVLEHGLHIFAGFYHNAFLTLKGCYEELGGAGGVPAADVFDAFRPQNRVMLVEREDGREIPWPIDFLPMPGRPGEGEAVPSVAHFIEALLHAIYSHYVGGAGKPDHGGDRAPYASVAALPAHLAARVGAAVAASEPEFVARYFHDAPHSPPAGDGAAADPHGLHHAIVVARAGKLDAEAPAGAHFPDVLALLRRFETHVETALHVGALEDWLRRIRRGVNLATAVIAGMTAADAANKGFDALDGQELKTWLKSHGAWDETVAWAPVDAGYDYAFAYGGGDPARPLLGAGTGLRGFLRLLFAYKGALFWEMLGSMGEVVILPMYLTLLGRGVKFQFFHRVDALRLDAAGTAVAAVEMTRQAELAGTSYDPLIPVGDRRAWPDRPNWDQLENGKALKDLDVDLEDPAATPPGAVARTLRLGVDFDQVVLGISHGALAGITADLAAASAPWACMAGGIVTTPTIALQLWTVPDMAGLGVKHPGRVTTGTDQPLSSWSDMSFLIPLENWPDGHRPGAILYFCGQLPDAAAKAPAPADAARTLAVDWLKRNAGDTFPNAAVRGGPLGFDPAMLFADAGAVGAARFDQQYWRANVHPSDRYVQSAPGTLAARLAPGASGFANLFLAGDWTRNGLNAGCVEAAVMSGLQCAGALLGDATPVPGESDA